MGYPNTLQGDHATPYETGSVQLYPLGQRLECPNGLVFRYAQMGASVAGVIAKLYQSEVPGANFDALAITTDIAVGDIKVAFANGVTVITEDMFEGGYLCVEETDDLGEPHRIRANTAHNGISAEPVTAWLYDGDSFRTVVTVAANNVVTLVKSPYRGIIVHPSPPTAMVVGIPRVVIAVNAYGWVQTHGVASCVTEGTLVIGQEVRPSVNADGAVINLDYDGGVAGLGCVGRVIEVAPTTDFSHIFLTLEGA